MSGIAGANERVVPSEARFDGSNGHASHDFYQPLALPDQDIGPWSSSLYLLPSDMVDSPGGGGVYGGDDLRPAGGLLSSGPAEVRYGNVGYDDGTSAADFLGPWVQQQPAHGDHDHPQPEQRTHQQSIPYVQPPLNNTHFYSGPGEHPQPYQAALAGPGPSTELHHPPYYQPGLPSIQSHLHPSSPAVYQSFNQSSPARAVTYEQDHANGHGHVDPPPPGNLRDIGMDDAGSSYAQVVGSSLNELARRRPEGEPRPEFASPFHPHAPSFPPNHGAHPTSPHSASYLQTSHRIPPFHQQYPRRQSDASYDRQMAPLPRAGPFLPALPQPEPHTVPSQLHSVPSHPSDSRQSARTEPFPHLPPMATAPSSSSRSPIASTSRHREDTGSISVSDSTHTTTSTKSTNNSPPEKDSPTSTSSSVRSAPDGAPTSSSEPPNKRLAAKRTPIACQRCRAHKLKCAGGNPCPGCQKRGVGAECSYVAEIKRRGKGKGRAALEAERAAKKKGSGSSGSTGTGRVEGEAKAKAETSSSPRKENVKEEEAEPEVLERDFEAEEHEEEREEEENEMEVEEERGSAQTSEKRWPSGTGAGAGGAGAGAGAGSSVVGTGTPGATGMTGLVSL